jgi:hypothetical protein
MIPPDHSKVKGEENNKGYQKSPPSLYLVDVCKKKNLKFMVANLLCLFFHLGEKKQGT